MKRFRKWLRTRPWPLRLAIKGVLAVLLFISPVALYLFAGWALGSIPVNGGFASAKSGVEIRIWSNGVHTDVVVPAVTEVMDWNQWLAASNANHVALGWGDKGFFLNVPQWRDLTFRVALDALVLNGEAAMHVTWLDQPPAPGPACKRIIITAEQYRTLTAYLTNSFRLDAAGKPVRIAAAGYGDHDAFFEATGHYGPVHTCNEWTGGALRKSGVRTGVWTPFEGAVMMHLPD